MKEEEQEHFIRITALFLMEGKPSKDDDDDGYYDD